MKKTFFVIFMLLFSANFVSSQDYNLNAGVRSVSLSLMPVGWFESYYRNYSGIEVFEMSVLPLIDVKDLSNIGVIDNIDCLNRVLLNRISEQHIDTTHGKIIVRRYEFKNESELQQFYEYIFRNPHIFKNVFVKDSIIYDIDYENRNGFDNISKIIQLDEIETMKLTLTNYPLPFSFILESNSKTNTIPSYIKDYKIIKYTLQEFNYNSNTISIAYYMFRDFSISEFRKLADLHPDEEFLFTGNVLIHIKGDYG